MKKNLLLVLIFIVSFSGFSLTLNLKEGQSFILKIKINDRTEIGDTQASSKISVFSEYTFKLHVDKAKNGVYVISSRLLRAKVKNVTPSGIREFDTDKTDSLKDGFLFGYFQALKEIPVKTYLDASNCRVIKIEGLKKVFDRLFERYGFGGAEQKSIIRKNLESNLKAVQSGFRSKVFGFQFCGKDFEKVKTFETEDNIEIMGLNLKQKIRYFVKEISSGKAVLTFETFFATDKESYKEIEGVRFIYKMKGSGKGETTINTETGMMENYRLVQKVTGSYSAENLNYSIPFNSETEYEFSLKKSEN